MHPAWNNDLAWRAAIYNAYDSPRTPGLVNINNNGPSIMNRLYIEKFVMDFGSVFGAAYYWREFIVNSPAETATSEKCYPHYYAVKSCNPCN